MPQSNAQQETVSRVMHEFKEGDLKSSAGSKVKNPKQAIAIALHEAGASNQASPADNRRNLRKTKARERSDEGSAKSSSKAPAKRTGKSAGKAGGGK